MSNIRTSKLDDVGDISAPVGSKEWAIAIAGEIRMEFRAAQGTVEGIQWSLKQMRDSDAWKQLTDKSGYPFMSWGMFLESDWIRIPSQVADAILKERNKDRLIEDLIAETPTLKEHGTNQHQPSSGVDNIKSSDDGGTSQSYLIARMKRDAPEIVEQLKEGQFPSVRAAAIAAGIVKVPTPYDHLVKAWKKATDDEKARFLVHINKGEP